MPAICCTVALFLQKSKCLNLSQGKIFIIDCELFAVPHMSEHFKDRESRNVWFSYQGFGA